MYKKRYKQMKKGLAFLFAAIFLLTGMPFPAQGATSPAFSKTYTMLYENGTNKGVYKLKVKNLKKGYITKWSVSKTGKRYASFDTNRIVAKSKSVTNVLTVDSMEEASYSAAPTLQIRVKVYTAKKALISELSFEPTLHRKAESIQLNTSKIENLKQLAPGTAYQFQASMYPSNTTSKLCWQVTGADGKDYSKEITSDGKWTPSAEGNYTVTAYALKKNSSTKLCPQSVEASVGCYLASVSQSAANGVRVTFGSDVSARFKETDYSIRSGESILPIKRLKYSEDGKTAYLTTTQNFVNGMSYTVYCNGSGKEFKASMGAPAELAILTTSIPRERFTTIKYQLLDANGIDVTDNADGVFYCTGDIKNGYLDEPSKRVYMNVLGSQGTITMTYASKDGSIKLSDTKQITCVEPKAQQAATTHFTLTTSPQEPLYKDADVRTITIGDTMYAHFQGLDEDDNVITYDSVTYQSSDPDKLIISSDGRITPIKSGNVMVVATAKQGSDSIAYPYSITVRDAKFPSNIQMERTYITMSSSADADYSVKVPVTAYDQYGSKYTLVNETGTITPAFTSISNGATATYDSNANCVEITARNATPTVYNFTLTIAANNRNLSQSFSVYVTKPTTGTPTYQVEATPSTVDLSIDENTVESNHDVEVRLAEYIGGIFKEYLKCKEITIKKGVKYYNENLQQITSGSSNLVANSTTTSGSGIASNAKTLKIKPLQFTYGIGNAYGTCTKAETGTYLITMTATDETSRTLNLTVTDKQSAPAYNLRSLTPNVSVSNALDLVKNCIQLPDGGTILNCTATGTSQTGGNILLRSGEMIHIEYVRVSSVVTIAGGQRISVESDLWIDKTFTNR